jgi:cytochrome c
MGFRIPGSLIMTAGLLAAGFTAGATSLAVQRWQTKTAAAQAAASMAAGDTRAGKALFRDRGCGACHSIRGVEKADGSVGPPLDGVASRALIAGRHPNEPGTLTAFVQHPQALEPGTGMPDVGLTDQEARDVTAYLYTLN